LERVVSLFFDQEKVDLMFQSISLLSQKPKLANRREELVNFCFLEALSRQ